MTIKNFKRSLLEFKDVKNLCTMAFLIAMMMGVRMVSTIKISSFLEIQFGFLVFLIGGSMFGPVFAVFFGFISDILGFYLLGSSSAFHWGFTLSSIVSAFIYGLFLYKFKLGFVRVALVQIFRDILVGFFMNTYWLAHGFSDSFLKAFAARFIKESVMLPVNCFLSVAFAILFKRVIDGLKINSLNNG